MEAPPAYNESYNTTESQPVQTAPPQFNPAYNNVQQHTSDVVQSVELQIQNNQYVQQPIPQSIQVIQVQQQAVQNNIPLDNTYAVPPADDNHKWINDDELPPDYEDIIKGEQSEAPKSGDGCAAGCKATGHYKAWFFTIVLLFFLFSFLACFLLMDDQCFCDCTYSCDEYDGINIATCDSYDLECSFPCSMTFQLSYGFWIILGVVYGMYWIEVGCCSSSRKYLSNIHDQETIYQYIERLHTFAPTIWWKVECYHYETRTRTVTDSDGNSRTETYTVRVVTHTANANYQYNSWKDVSVSMNGLHEYKLTKLSNYKTFTFANNATENDYNYKAAEFRRNNDRDTHQDFWYGLTIAEFKAKMLVEVEPGTRSKAVSLTCYLLSSMILCTTCYRMYFASVCGRKKYVFNKQVSI